MLFLGITIRKLIAIRNPDGSHQASETALRFNTYLFACGEQMRIQAEFIVVDSQRILTNAQIEVDRGRIRGLCETPQLKPDLHLGRSVILPGFINAHTHLEFSDLQSPIAAGVNFPNWIAAVVQRRRELATQSSIQDLEYQRRKAIRNGHEECCACGTSLIVDIVTQPWNPLWLNDSEGNVDGDLTDVTRVIALAEILGLEPQRLSQTGEWARVLNAEHPPLSESCVYVDIGWSPHATYSLLYPQIHQIIDVLPRQRLIAMHVAESLDERQWLEQTSGAFHNLFQDLGLAIHQPPMQIYQAIELMSKYERSLLIHGNYLNAKELDTVSRYNMAVVYCPRTHRHFSHSEYPLKEILRREIPLLLGTDSRASNPDLNIWDECKTALKQHATWSPAQAFAAITNTAANFLGVEKDFGSLDVGRLAWINTVDTPAGATAENLLESLLSSAECSKPLPLRLKKL